jgi:hypothetical protein
MSGFLLKGGLIEFTESFPIPIPNVVIFQYNPETMTHGWTPATTAPDTPGSNPMAITGQPKETFSFTLMMDSNDTIADGNAVIAGLAEISGLYTRLAALEMLLFPSDPPGGGLIGSVTAALGIGGGAASPSPTQTVPNGQLPTVLFVWGPGRIVPVRVQALSFTEKLYDPILLNPIHVEAQMTLQVLNQDELKAVSSTLLGGLANTAYSYTQTLREALALANLANAASSLVGMLPI